MPLPRIVLDRRATRQALQQNAFRDKVTVVTGAGSGIGRQLALELARRGARLALSDVAPQGLDETAQLVTAIGAPVHTATLDVADRAAVEKYAAAVLEHYPVVHQLYNNAGVAGASGTVLETEWDEFERVLSINLWGVIHGTKAFLPHLISSGDGHLVNISSLNGFMAQPGLGPYCTTKFGVRGFTEAVHGEMLAEGHPVKVTVVHPGGVRTNIASAALERAQEKGIEVTEEDRARVRFYNEKLLRLPAERAATIILDGVARGRSRVLVGNDARSVDRLVRLVPEHYPRIVSGFTRRMAARAGR